MGNGLIALLVAIGVATWIYAKMMRSTGSNVKNSLTIAGVAALLLFILILFLLRLIPS